MHLKKGLSIELTIHDLAFEGVAVGRYSDDVLTDYVVFVSGGALAGEKVRASLTKIKKNYAEAQLEEVLSPSPQRITPRCKHFEICGGCTFQSLDYPNQLGWKEKTVADALRKIGGFRLEMGSSGAVTSPEQAGMAQTCDKLPALKIAPILGCAEPWFYRNKMEYSFGDETLEGRTDEPVLGLHPPKKFYQVFELQECFLESPLSVEVARGVQAWVREHKLPVYHSRRDDGVVRNLIIREGKNTGELLVNLITTSNDFPEAEFTSWATSTFPQITSLYRTVVSVQRGHRTVQKEYLLAGKPTLSEKLHVTGEKELTFEILPQAFFQPNTRQAELLYRTVVEFAGGAKQDRVLDLFCGTGTIGMFFAAQGGAVFGIDINKSAIDNARRNATFNGLENIDFLCGDIGQLFNRLTEKPTLMITDPPRSGIDKKNLLKLMELRIPRWIYVSCNPTTLARDLKLICGGAEAEAELAGAEAPTEATGETSAKVDGASLPRYAIKKIQPVDMFPQTYHVETVCLIELDETAQ